MRSILLLTESIVVFFCLSCSSNQDLLVEFEPIPDGNKLDIEVPEKYLFDRDYKWSLRNSEEGQMLIRVTNMDDQVIVNTLNLDSMLLNSSLTIPRYGPNGFKSASPSIYYHNSDSIFLLTTALNQILVYNDKAEKLNQIKIRYDLPLSIDANEDQQSFALMNDELVGHAVPYLNPNARDFFERTPSHIYVDLSNGEVTEIPYDSELFGKISPTDFLGGQVIRLNEVEYLFSNYYAHSIEVYNTETGIKRSLTFGISQLEEFKPVRNAIDNSSFEKALMVLRYPKYYAIIYDHLNGIIYRFVQILNPKYHGLSNQSLTDELVRNNQNLLRNVVVATNRDFSIFKYIEIPRHAFYAPIKDGLLTSSSIEPTPNEETFFFYSMSDVISALKK